MSKFLSLTVIIFFVFTTSASDVLYKRLDNLYKKDKKQCLVVAKRYIKYIPNQSSPFYFATVLYVEKSKKSKTTRGQYLHLRKAIGYAIKFEDFDNESLESQVEWTEFKKEMNGNASELIEKLELENDFALSERLSSRLSTFNNEYFVADVAVEVESNDIVEAFNHSNVTKVFNGMPTGNEIIHSADINGEQELLGYINAERKKKGMVPLVWDEDLAKASRYHSYDLATQNYFNHSTYDRKNGKLVKVGGTFDRIKKFYSKSFVNSENIAAGNSTAKATYMQWFNSKGHYENMFNPSSTKIGIGVFYVEDSPFGHYWSMCTAL